MGGLEASGGALKLSRFPGDYGLPLPRAGQVSLGWLGNKVSNSQCLVAFLSDYYSSNRQRQRKPQSFYSGGLADGWGVGLQKGGLAEPSWDPGPRDGVFIKVLPP
jgi:hypothetical protein